MFFYFRNLSAIKYLLGQEYINNQILIEEGVSKNAFNINITLTKIKKGGKQSNLVFIFLLKVITIQGDTGQNFITKFCQCWILYHHGTNSNKIRPNNQKFGS